LNSLPLVIGETLNPMSDFAGGTGESNDPYQISNWTHLNNVRNHLSSHFILTANLDSSTDGYDIYASSTANGGSGWLPLGDDSTKFTGNFDGEKYTISDLYISGTDTVGLFGISNGNIHDVSLIDIDIFGDSYVGAIVGINEGHIEKSYSTGTVEGSEYVGGLVGFNKLGSVLYSYSTCNIQSGMHNLGGLVGRNTGSINNSYSTGNVEGFIEGGGLVGINTGSINNSYSTGNVEGMFDNGGLVGINNGIVTSSFYDKDTSGHSDTGKGVGKNTTEMQTITTFSDAGWDIALYDEWDGETWFIKNPSDYPRLGWEYEPMDEEPDPEPVTNEITINLEYFGPAEDINHDGIVNIHDVSILIANFGMTGDPGWIRADITKSGSINIHDITQLISKYGLVWLVIV
jgi:hypothetical protein